jgi:hypothetical protein
MGVGRGWHMMRNVSRSGTTHDPARSKCVAGCAILLQTWLYLRAQRTTNPLLGS